VIRGFADDDDREAKGLSAGGNFDLEDGPLGRLVGEDARQRAAWPDTR